MMLTANRFDEIKTFVAGLHGKPIAMMPHTDIAELARMAAELAAEIQRMRTPAQAQGRGHLRPVVLDAKGQPVAPPPLHLQFAAERRELYDADRLYAIMHTEDLNHWRVFSLRWGLAPPPGGWDDHETQYQVIHAVRLGIKAVPYLAKVTSATWLTSRGIKLPPGVTFTNGELLGVETPE